MTTQIRELEARLKSLKNLSQTTQIRELEAKLKRLKSDYKAMLDDDHWNAMSVIVRLTKSIEETERKLADLKFNEAFNDY